MHHPVSNEEPPPPLNASPHPPHLPYLTVAQQHHLDVQAWVQQNVPNNWEAPANQNQHPQNEWGVWPEAEVPFQGYNLRELTEYEGSILDGVTPEQNISDDPRTWSPAVSDDEVNEVEAAADRFLVGIVGGQSVFVRAGGPELNFQFPDLQNVPFTAHASVFEDGQSSGTTNQNQVFSIGLLMATSW